MARLGAGPLEALAPGLDYAGDPTLKLTKQDDREVSRLRESALAGIARALSADAVHLVDPSRFAHKRKLKTITTCHDLIPIVLAKTYYPGRPLHRWQLQRQLLGALTQADHVIWTGPDPAQRFGNSIRSMTIDTGRGNVGAIGAQFHANNQGVIYDVTFARVTEPASPAST